MKTEIIGYMNNPSATVKNAVADNQSEESNKPDTTAVSVIENITFAFLLSLGTFLMCLIGGGI